IPDLTVLRPADANEVSAAWHVALEHRGPVALILSRQKLPIFEETRELAMEGVRRGAYVLRDPTDGSPPQVALVATGSEVSVALAAADRLAADGVAARVVSMPSWELFDEQDVAYQREVLPATLPKVVVEAAASFGWARWTAGAPAAYVTLDRFGASAPAEILFDRLGFTPANVAAQARRLLV
ncbi:MAG TPA: transketolase C-terminal domain-containing protein, partial [Polyangiaceae bacterium LLY-WYZ-14_1]|nr:transketolase C-terminal domain-containing protein [Polyangiaceae bacterium LLY-WYZ-14_1]